MPDGSFRFITGKEVLHIRATGEDRYETDCDADKWEEVWKDYFDLDRNYRAIRDDARGRVKYVDMAIERGKGIRILRQDLWEILITFIISQRKNIPAISASVEKLCALYGEKLINGSEELYSFPTAADMRNATIEGLRSCSLGYRAEYIHDAVRRANDCELDMVSFKTLEDDALFEELCGIKGVGKKVANCVMLFGYGRVDRAPVDVWIQRVIDENGGVDIFEDFSGYAGIIQQYLFYYRRYIDG